MRVVGRRRRRWSWHIGGIDVRLPLAIILPLAFVGGGMLREPAAAVAPASGDIVGIASVIDGDTIEIHGRRIRFDGIDAPESSQVCVRGGVKERCGQKSAMFLADAIGRRTVSCSDEGRDRYGRTIGRCYLGDQDLNAAMVEAGHAVAYRHFSTRYVPEEEKARAAGAGVWGTKFEMPWDWRRTH